MSSLNKRQTSHAQGSLTLALCAPEGRLLMALGRPAPGGKPEILFAQDWQATAQGVELLAPALDFALAAQHLTPRHIGRIAAVNGPGSFTGLRLTIVTAAALARALGAHQAALPLLPLLAAQAAASGLEFNAAPNSELWAVTHARRGLVHAQGFKTAPAAGATGDSPSPSSEILVLSLEEAAALLHGRALWACGSGISQNRAFFSATLPGARLLGPDFDRPAPALLLAAALKAEYSAADIAPLYARQSDAEENLPQIAARLGQNPEAAARRLADILAKPPQNHT